MGKIILIGTEHGDLKGSERLESLLEIVRPDILSVEFSLESLRLSQDDSADITKIISEARERGVSNTFIHFFEDLIAKQGLTDFGYTTSRSYADKHKIPLVLSDDPRLASACRVLKLDVLHRMISGLPANIELPAPSEEELIRDTDRYYEFAANVIKGAVPQAQVDRFLESHRGVLIGQRDVHMEQMIRLNYNPISVLVHICGFAHLFDDSKRETLYSRIKDLKPQRHLLFYSGSTL